MRHSQDLSHIIQGIGLQSWAVIDSWENNQTNEIKWCKYINKSFIILYYETAIIIIYL